MSLNSAYPLGFTLPAPVSEIISGGFFDYNDSATTTTPISITGGGGFVQMTNDGLGANTNKAHKPADMTEVWNTLTNAFDWSELKLGDTVEVRVDIDVTTTVANQLVECDLFMAVGDAGAYELSVFQNIFKSAGSHHVVRYIGLYMGDAATLNNPAQIKVSSDANATAIVNGWYVNVTKRG